jgi:hypothetical protein
MRGLEEWSANRKPASHLSQRWRCIANPPVWPVNRALDLPIHNSPLDPASKIDIEAVELFDKQREQTYSRNHRREDVCFEYFGVYHCRIP